MTKILSESDESIIIIQGDTGSSILNNPDISDYMKKRLSILYAIYIPNADTKSFSKNISPVNTYRIIFNNYFETNLEILDNRYYWHTYSNEIDDNRFKDITEIMD